MDEGTYTKKEIKLAIDEATQFSMYHVKEDKWNILMELQSRLYEQFGIED